MTPEEMKKTWDETSERMNSQSSDNLDIPAPGSQTALERLKNSYHRFSILGLALCFCSLAYINIDLFPGHLRLWITLSMCLYFGICSVMDYWLYKGISSINCYNMTVKEVTHKALFYRKRHHQFMIFLIPCAVALVSFMAYSLKTNLYALIGIFCGIIIGLAIGLRKYFDFMTHYKTLTDI